MLIRRDTASGVAAIIAGAAAWWMLQRRERADAWDGIAETRWNDESPNPGSFEDEMAIDAESGDTPPLRDRVGAYASSARETAGEYAASARETVGEYAESARTSAVRASARVRGAARTATSNVDDFARTNPLAAGAIALAVGALIGLAMPRTALEDSAMGETRDRAWEKASRAASNIKDVMAEKMATAAENFIGESLADAARGTSGRPMGRA